MRHAPSEILEAHGVLDADTSDGALARALDEIVLRCAHAYDSALVA